MMTMMMDGLDDSNDFVTLFFLFLSFGFGLERTAFLWHWHWAWHGWSRFGLRGFSYIFVFPS
jgi:hypothetical protein